MAIFPQGKTRVRERANAGEKRVLDALARHLEDDYAVWHNIPIMGSGREPDFVILHPQRGLLILEVKDWKRQTIANANSMLVELNTPNGLTNTVHPVSQARGYMLDLNHQLQRFPELLHPDGPHRGKLLADHRRTGCCRVFASGYRGPFPQQAEPRRDAGRDRASRSPMLAGAGGSTHVAGAAIREADDASQQ